MQYYNVINFQSAKEGAQTTIFLAVSEEVAGISGKYFKDCKVNNNLIIGLVYLFV